MQPRCGIQQGRRRTSDRDGGGQWRWLTRIASMSRTPTQLLPALHSEAQNSVERANVYRGAAKASLGGRGVGGGAAQAPSWKASRRRSKGSKPRCCTCRTRRARRLAPRRQVGTQPITAWGLIWACERTAEGSTRRSGAAEARMSSSKANRCSTGTRTCGEGGQGRGVRHTKGPPPSGCLSGCATSGVRAAAAHRCRRAERLLPPPAQVPRHHPAALPASVEDLRRDGGPQRLSPSGAAVQGGRVRRMG